MGAWVRLLREEMKGVKVVYAAYTSLTTRWDRVGEAYNCEPLAD
jgi:hypothetical protein